MNTIMRYFAPLLLVFLGSWSLSAWSQTIPDAKPLQTSTQAGDHTIHYTVVMSQDLPASAIRAYNLVAGDNKALVNVAVTKAAAVGGLAANIKGYASNLMGQRQALTFQEIREPGAIYYLAPFQFNHRDTMNFELQVDIGTGQPSQVIRFTRQLFHGK